MDTGGLCFSHSPGSFPPEHADDVGAHALERPPAVLLSHPLSVALRRGRGAWRAPYRWQLDGFQRDQSGRRTPGGRGLRFGRPCPWVEGSRRENHLSFVARVPAHVRLESSLALAGVGELPEAPHQLDKEVPGVFVVRPAGLRLPHELAPVRAAAALARHPQLGVLAVAGDAHGAQVLGLGPECDGLLPDRPSLLGLRLGWPEAAGEQRQQSAGLGPHGVRRMPMVREGEFD